MKHRRAILLDDACVKSVHCYNLSCAALSLQTAVTCDCSKHVTDRANMPGAYISNKHSNFACGMQADKNCAIYSMT